MPSKKTRNHHTEQCGANPDAFRCFNISSRSHYGLVFATELARRFGSDKPVSVHSIANDMGISEKYLEELVGVLRRGRIVRGARGRSGGYVLTKSPAQVHAGAVVRLLDGPVLFARCQVASSKKCCPANARCGSKQLFTELKKLIDQQLDSVTLADLVMGSARI